jgi:putative DNA primase/helicase
MNRATPITVDPEMIARHVELLFRDTDGFVPVRLLMEKDGVEVRKYLPFEPVAADLSTRIITRAQRAAASGAGTFVVPGTVAQAGSAKASDIAQMRCVLVDLDKGNIAAARTHLEAHVGKPSLVVQSGGLTAEGQHRIHLYWRLSEVVKGDDLARLCAVRGLLAAKVGGDPSFDSAHQPIRLAGSIYAKSKVQRLVAIIDQADISHSFADIDRMVSAMPTLPGLEPSRIKIDTGRKGPTAAELKLTRIRSEGQDEITRIDAIGKVIGHWLNVVRSGRMTLADAWLRVEEHNAACVDPPWETSRLRKSFDALLKRDIASHGPMPNFGQLVVSPPTDDENVSGQENASQAAVLPEVVFLSEDDLADRFVSRFRRELRYVPARGAWMVWTGRSWKQDETRLASNGVRLICRATADTVNDEKMARKLCAERTINAVEKLARSDPRMAEPAFAWDRGDMIINTPAGTLDLVTGEMQTHSPNDLLTRISKGSPTGDCPRWNQFLSEVTNGKAGLADYLQRIAGYCLTGRMTEHVFFFLHGTGANGKSVFIDALSHVLGDYAATAPLDTFTSVNGERHPTDLAGLATARAVFVTETEQGRPWAESRIKAITGGDTLRVRFLYRDFFEVQPTFKIVVAGNARPRLVGVGEAMKRRLHLIPFDVTIPEEQRDKTLLDQLHRERDGIFQWMLEGCKTWQKVGLQPPQCVREAADEYFRDEDLVTQWIEERCLTDAGARAPSAQLYKNWIEWADARGFDRGSQRSLGEELRMRGFRPYRTGRERGWCGLQTMYARTADHEVGGT